MTDTPFLETKTMPDELPHDLNGAFEGFMRTFEAYKHENNGRLRDIEKRSSDVLTDEKMARLDRALDDAKRLVDHVALKSLRPQLGLIPQRTASDREHK